MNKAEKRQKLSSSSSDEEEDFGQKDDSFEMDVDEEERERFNQMSEKEREIEIFKRLEQRENQKRREQIKRKLEMAGKKDKPSSSAATKKKRKISEDSDNEVSDGVHQKKNDGASKDITSDEDEEEINKDDDGISDNEEEEGEIKQTKKKKKTGTIKTEEDEEETLTTEYFKPSEVASKQNKIKAMADLLNKRQNKKQVQEKRKKEAEKKALDLDETSGNDDKEDGKSSSSSSSSTSSSRSSSPASPKSRSPSPVAQPIQTRDDLIKCQAIRRRLARIVHAPFFAKTIIGCFVRVQIGANDGRPTYRIAQVTDVVETAKIYEVEPGTEIRTNKGFKLKICNNETQRVIRLEFVSNGDFMESEFQFWLTRMHETNTPLPTIDFVVRKQKELLEGLNYKYTDSEINLMVKEKQRFKRNPTNFAFQKSELLKQKEDAEQNGDTERVRDYQQQINDLEEKAKKIETQRNKNLSAVTAINQRNREHMKQIFLSSEHMASNEHNRVKDDDPFTRKSARMKMVTGGMAKVKQQMDESDVNNLIAPGSSMIMANPSLTLGEPSASSHGIGNDLLSSHGIDINIDLNKVLPATFSSSFRPHLPSTESHHQHSHMSANHIPPKSASTRTLTLEEYKKKYSARMASAGQ